MLIYQPRDRHRPSGEPLIRPRGSGRSSGRTRTASSARPTPTSRAVRSCARRRAASRPCATSRFDVWPGEVFVVMGLSGSGKSTLVRTLIRLIEPTAGTIEIAEPGRDRGDGRRAPRAAPPLGVDGLPALRPPRAPPRDRQRRLRARDPGRAEGTSGSRGRRELLELVGLEDVEKQFPDQLSGGMQQRVGVARAFAVDPAVMLYDEPFSALDPLIRRDMQDEVMPPPGGDRARRWSSSPTTSPRRFGSATGSRSCATGAIVQLGTPGGGRRLARRRLRRELRPRHPAQPRPHAALDHAAGSAPARTAGRRST